MLLYYLIVSVIIFCFILIYRKRVSKYAVVLKAYPLIGVRSLPLLGLAHHFIGSNERRMKSLQLFGLSAVAAGGASASWLGHIPLVVIADAEMGDFLLKTCLDKDSIMKILRCIVGDGLIIAPMSVWRHRRRILVPTFTTKNLRGFLRVFNKQANIMVEQLKPKVGGEVFPMWKYLAHNNMDIVSEAVFGKEINSQTDPNNPFLQSGAELASMMAFRLSQPWLHSDFVFKLLPMYQSFKKHLHTIYTIVDGVMEAKRKELEEIKNDNIKIRQNKVKPFLELLLESSLLENGTVKGGYSDEELREETMTLMIAGTDTSAAGLAFAVLCLSKYQDVQDKVYNEILEVFGDSYRPVEPDDVKKLIYMDAVIREAMRLYPPVPAFLRRVSEDITLPSGLVIPEGCTIMMNVWALHRNPKYWGDDADEFRPERFLVPLKHPAQYMAFGYGPRNCPGNRYGMMSMITVLVTLLRRYRLRPNREGDFSVRVTFEIFLKDADLFQVRLENRKATQSEG